MLKKVEIKTDSFMDKQVSQIKLYKYSSELYESRPELKEQVACRIIQSNVFDYLTDILYFKEEIKDEPCIKVIGRQNDTRTFRYIKEKYLNLPDSHSYYRLLYPASYGSTLFQGQNGALITGQPEIIEPNVAFTQTFISVGSFNTRNEAENAEKYLKTKFARFMLAILKVTPGLTRERWAKVPVQNFTTESDIEWSRSIYEINQQLYRKYELSKEEIDFIEKEIRSLE